MGASPAAAVDGRETSATPIGDLGSPGRASVDAAGRITVRGRSWSVDWWIGAGDRWRRPGEEPSTRQALVDDTPVVQTLLRVPGGDVASRAFVVGGTVVMEVENLSPVPVAVAFCLEPPVARIELAGDRVLADGDVALVLPRAPSGTAWAVDIEPDVTHLEPGDGSVRDRGRAARAAFVFPLPHRASMRVRVPLGLTAPAAGPPSAEAVARSWAAHRRRGAEAVLPPGPLADALAAATCFVLLAGDQADIADSALVVDALDRAGFAGEAAALLRGWLARQRGDGGFGGQRPIRTTGAALTALATHWRLTGDDDFLAAVLPAVALGVSALRRAGRSADAGDLTWAVSGLDGAAALLRHGGHPPVAARAESHAAAARAALGQLDPVPVPVLMPDGARWDAPASVAGLVSRVWRMLAHATAGGELALCTAVPAEWEGQGWQVNGAPTELGVVSFAVRWHGMRPALLWECTGDGPVRIVAPGLDPAWSSTARSGEALLRVERAPG